MQNKQEQFFFISFPHDFSSFVAICATSHSSGVKGPS